MGGLAEGEASRSVSIYLSLKRRGLSGNRTGELLRGTPPAACTQRACGFVGLKFLVAFANHVAGTAGAYLSFYPEQQARTKTLDFSAALVAARGFGMQGVLHDGCIQG